MHIGLFLGSFNPVHIGHLVVANYMAHYTAIEQVWMLVSPHNPLKRQAELADKYDRLAMVKLAIADAERLQVSDIEFELPTPSYTIHTLSYLKSKYPLHRFSLIMGSDALASLEQWRGYELILSDYSIWVYPRPGTHNNKFLAHSSVILTEAPRIEISSTFIRKALTAKKNLRFFLPDLVLKFIETKGLYADLPY